MGYYLIHLFDNCDSIFIDWFFPSLPPSIPPLLDYGGVYASALMIGGFSHGLIYVAGMCYVHVRAGPFRAQRIGLLLIMYTLAIATNAHAIHEYEKDYAEPRDDGLWAHATKPVAYHFFAFSGATLVVLLINFLLQGRLYDYKLIQDDKLNLANAKCDNFKSTLGAPVLQAIAPKAEHFHQLKVTKVLLLAKLKGGMAFNNLFLGVVFYASTKLFTGEDEQYTFVIHYLMLLGVLFGFLASFFMQLKWIFIPSTFIQCTLLIVGLSLYSGGNYVTATVFMWLFYMILGVGYVVPDVGLMEVAPLPFYETLAAVGYCFEAVPMMIATYFMNYSFPPGGAHLWAAGGVLILGILLGAIGMIFWYPETLRRGHIDIQYMVLYPGKVINVRTPPPPGSTTVDILPAPHPNAPTTTLPAPTPIPVQPPVAPPVPYPDVQKVPVISVTDSNSSSLYPPVHFNEPTAPVHQDEAATIEHKTNYSN